MINYIFDLDYTLYSKKDVDETDTTQFYKSFKKKPFLNKLLLNLKGNKYIFSNGNKEHVNEVLNRMKLTKIFKNVANINEYNNPKPHIDAYKYVIEGRVNCLPFIIKFNRGESNT